jgi:hypothetical protein
LDIFRALKATSSAMIRPSGILERHRQEASSKKRPPGIAFLQSVAAPCLWRITVDNWLNGVKMKEKALTNNKSQWRDGEVSRTNYSFLLVYSIHGAADKTKRGTEEFADFRKKTFDEEARKAIKYIKLNINDTYNIPAGYQK